MTKKIKIGVVAIMLSLVMFLQSVPMGVLRVFADALSEAFTTEETANENLFVQPDKLESINIDDTKQLDDAYIVEENVESRTINSKEFAMSDGSIVVQYYAQNVHYLEEGTFKEIDNTLIETKNEEGETIYENKSNFYKVRINKNFEPNEEFIEVENKGYGLNFTYIENSARKTFGEKHNVNKEKTVNQYKGKKLKTPKEIFTGEGKISYNNISEHIDLEYEVKDNGIKENIIVRDYLSDYDFDFKIKIKNLDLQKNEDGSISAIDEKGNTKYLIPAPFMFDANGKYNFEVEYFLNKLGKDYILTISADKKWIEEEARLPVTIDPIIETVDNKIFSYVNVYEKGSGLQSTSEVYVGEKEDGNKSNAYFRFNLHSKAYNYALVKANLKFYGRNEGMGIFNWKNIKFSASVVDSSMMLSEITYTNKPERLQFLRLIGADVNIASTEGPNDLALDLNVIKGDVLTIGLERENNHSSGAYVRIYTTGTNGISLSLRYKQITGLDDSYSMESSKITGATAYVNKATGLLTLNCDFASVNNLSSLPLKTSLVYNALYNDIFTEIGVPLMFGNDFKLNFQQYVREELNDYITLYDADGSITTLNYDKGGSVYRTTDGKLTASVLGIRTKVFDTQFNTRIFENGRLCEIFKGREAATGSSYTDRIIISYVSSSGEDANKISNISFLRGFQNIVSSKIEFIYSGTRVSIVKTYQGTTEMATYTLTYDDSGNLIKVRNETGQVDIYEMEFEPYEGYIRALFNKENEGFYFTHKVYDDRVWKLNQVMGQNYNNSRWFDYIEFDYDAYSLTEAFYYENGRDVATSYVSFDISRNPISEWVEDERGKITGINRGYHNFEYSQNGYLYDYTRENVYFEEKLNTSFSGSVELSAGQTTSGMVTSSSGIVNNSYYRYGLTFFVEGTLNIDLIVTFGGQSKHIFLINGGALYVTLPCGYVESGTFVFKNNSTKGLTTISNVTYNIIDYVKETKSYGAEPENYNVYATTEVISYNRKGEFEQSIFDGHQRLITLNKRSIEDDVLETTTYTYNSTDLTKITQPVSIITNRDGTTVFSENYTYQESTNINTQTVVTTANGLKKKTVQSTEINADGYIITKTDENNVQTIETYTIQNGDVRLVSVKSNNITENYVYDHLGNITLKTLVDLNDNPILTATNSYTNGIVTEHTFGKKTLENNTLVTNTFTKTYDSLGFLSSISHNGNTMFTYAYEDDRYYSYDNYIKSKTYANGQIEDYSYNGNSTTIAYKKNSSDVNSDDYVYNNDYFNRLISSSYTQNGIEVLNYNYGDLNSTTQSTLNITGELTYDALFTVNNNDVYNRITSTSDKFTKDNVDTTYNVTYGYNNKGQIVSNSVGSYDSSVTYDAFDRLNSYVAKNNNNAIINKSYVYDSYSIDGTTYTTNRLKSITDNINSSIVQSSYDSNGFIESIQYNGKTHNYDYDSAGRLTSETMDGDERSYTYDEYNVITSINIGGNRTGYNYDTFGRITSYIDNNNNVANYFRYDAMGNPVMYKGAESNANDNMVWTQGRKLESGTLNGNAFSYAYDMNGLRYKKTVNGNVTEYYLDGSTIIAENRKTGTTDNLIYYIYDMMGLSGMVYNGENYYYEKNTLGDIIGIRNSVGTQVATYNYDAWGNIISKSGTMADINPFRYRGYYYDNETGFYYLQTRYYDPSIRMFINADDYEIVSTLAQTVGQLNMYAYCGNNPIMYTDPSGEIITVAAVLTFFAVVGISAIDGAVSAHLSGENWLIGAGTGALGGAVGYFFGILNPVLGRAVSSLIYDVANPLFQHDQLGESDLVNMVIDISLDVVTSSLYSTFLSKGKYKHLFNILITDIDAVIDIAQTEYILKPISKQFNQTHLVANMDITKLYLIGA